MKIHKSTAAISALFLATQVYAQDDSIRACEGYSVVALWS
jgi:hypothetical protein